MKPTLTFPLEEVREGKAKILVPRISDYRRSDGVYEPAWAPVFYNPRMSFNRDLAILFALAYRRLAGLDTLTVVEPLSGTGVRAIRYALEADANVVANDIDPTAFQLAQLNVERNNATNRVKLYNLDANELLSSLKRRKIRPSIIDIDPFGSPAPFLDTAIQAIGRRGVIAVTATDAAPLSGTHLRALRRRYDVRPGRTAWEKEQAVRVLAGYIIRRAACYEYGTRILLAYFADYYVRIIALLEKGAGRADKSLQQLAAGAYCPYCSYTGYTEEAAPATCPACGGHLTTVSPIYNGPLCDQETVSLMLTYAKKADWLENKDRAIKLLETLLEECSITRPYYRIDRVASVLRTNMPKPRHVVEALRVRGYQAALTHFDTRAVKTTAPHALVLETVRSLSPGHRDGHPPVER